MLDLGLEVFSLHRCLVGVVNAEGAEPGNERYHRSRAGVGAAEDVARLFKVFGCIAEAEVLIGDTCFGHGELALSLVVVLSN